jgi:hypothetical protein
MGVSGDEEIRLRVSIICLIQMNVNLDELSTGP